MLQMRLLLHCMTMLKKVCRLILIVLVNLNICVINVGVNKVFFFQAIGFYLKRGSTVTDKAIITVYTNLTRCLRKDALLYCHHCWGAFSDPKLTCYHSHATVLIPTNCFSLFFATKTCLFYLKQSWTGGQTMSETGQN